MKRRAHAGRVRSGGFSLNVFSEDEFKDVHLATLEVLEHTGVFTDDPEAFDIFEGGGAAVDREKGIVRIPPHVVEAAIGSAPERVFGAGRHPKDDIMFDAGRVGFTTFGEGIRIVDRDTGELRDPTKQDVADTARLADALDELDTYEIAVGAKDVPPETATIHSYEASLCSTSKHICAGPLSKWESEVMLDMAAAVVGGRDELRRRPILMIGVCPVSPLKLPRDCSEAIVARPAPASPATSSPWPWRGAPPQWASPARWWSTTPRCSPASRSRSSLRSGRPSSTAARRPRWTCGSRRPRSALPSAA
jgi:trimethylamine---corrinoid protein Co-methyltransferase